MNRFLFYNDEVLPDNIPLITASNRGLRYGDGLFETIKVINGAAPLLALHLDRLQQGLSVLQINLPPIYTPAYWQHAITELCRQNQVSAAARVRITILRSSGTLYSTEEGYATVIIQAEALADDYLRLNEKGLSIGIYTDVQKSCDILCNLKSNNYLPYIMAAQYTGQQGLNDCLILNTHGRICDATIANLFWVRNNTIFTPPLTEGCVAGVMRKHLLTQLPLSGYTVTEQACTTDDLQQADEVFLTNALYGIRWAQRVNNTQYKHELVPALYDQLIKKIHYV